MKLILASKSPRRKELLARLYPEFDIITKDVDETLSDGLHPKEGVELLAIRKGAAVADTESDILVVSSDTLVEKDGTPLGKPADGDDAMRMLKLLSDSWHNVHTGVAVHYKGRVYSGVSTTRVRFRQITDEEILWYIESGEPMDKAGAYGIQGLGGRFVSEYDGDYDTVVGLCLTLTETLINNALAEEKND